MFPAMNTPPASAPSASGPTVTAVAQINAFNWLLVLGFPPEVAAAVVRPDTFAR